MKKQSDLIKERLKNVMLTDRGSGIDKFLTSLKSDVSDLLRSYMYTDADSLNVSLDVRGDGDYELFISARGDRLIDVGKMID